jgi:hypothetical protein
MEALVVKDLDSDILGGTPFLKTNGIVIDFPTSTIYIDKKPVKYNIQLDQGDSTQIRRIQSCLLKTNSHSILHPGDFIEIPVPEGFRKDEEVAIEPRSDCSVRNWPEPIITSLVAGAVRLTNKTSEVVVLKKHQHLAQIRSTCDGLGDNISCEGISSTLPTLQHAESPFHVAISVDPSSQLSDNERRAFHKLHADYDSVFDSKIGKYNDASGKIRASINMGPVEPPPQKSRQPMYPRKDLDELQDKMDELEALGVLAKPEDYDVVVEHVSPSFLVKSPGGKTRLVTAFNGIASYAKPLPSRTTSCDVVIHALAQWKYVIKTDMTKQFYQLPMKQKSMKYLGVMTPYRGLRIYTRAAMGMPGSTEHLDNLMARVLGDLLREGVVVKLADDLYVGGNSVIQLLDNWKRVLQAFSLNNLRLSPTKTVICPVTTTILGWVWTSGRLQVSPHKINPLVSCEKPTTVKGLRSWIGAYKHIKSCIPQYSSRLSPLEAAVAGKDSHQHVEWSRELVAAFADAQAALKNPKTITIPRASDQLIITNDGAVRDGGVGSVLYIKRGVKMLLGGYYSAKLKTHQQKWLPCEVEALAIASAINHWSPYILHSDVTTQILTDSRPCIQALEKLKRGQFSSSARVTTFLSVLSRFNISMQHISGSSNLPADYLSRHPMECSNRLCQICKFISDSTDCTVMTVSVGDILQNKCPTPFTSRPSWKRSQQDCSALKRTFAHLSQGTRPSKKSTRMSDVKRYLNVATLSRDGLLVVKKSQPFMRTRDLIVIPRSVLPGLLTALHLRLQHPSKSQLHRIFHRSFYALDADHMINMITSSCAQCAALAKLPKEVVDYTTSPDPPDVPGVMLACDVMCRAKQKILVIRDYFSSFTKAQLIAKEDMATLRDALIEMSAELKVSSGTTIRADGATALQALVGDQILSQHGISMEIGRLKNINKNPVAEKAIQELENEITRQHPDGGALSTTMLAVIVATLNSRIRNRGLSAKEILFQRDNHSFAQLNISDSNLRSQQLNQRKANHLPSAVSKAPKGVPPNQITFHPGDLVYIKADGSKHMARNKYIVASVIDGFVFIRKLVGSQYRSKVYKMKPAELYHVPFSSVSSLLPGQVNISNQTYESASSSDSDSSCYEEHEQLTDSEDSNQSEYSTSEEDEADRPCDEVGRRQRRQPAWMQSGDWDLS